MLPLFFRVLVFFSKDVFKQHGILPFFSPSTNLEYHSRVGLLIVWFLIVCVYEYTFLHAFISDCLWCRPNTLQNSTECCLFFLRVPVVFFKEVFKQHGMLPIFIRVKQHGMLPIFLRVRIHPEYDSRVRIQSTNPEYDSRVGLPSTTSEYESRVRPLNTNPEYDS